MKDSVQRQLESARNPATTAAELEVLADSIYPFVVLAVTENVNTAPTTLARLAQGPISPKPDLAVLERIARHPSTPLETMLEIAEVVRGRLDTARENEGAARVARALIRRGDFPTEVVRSLLRESTTSTRFRAMVAGETTRDDVRDLLIDDRSSHVRRALGRSRTSPE